MNQKQNLPKRVAIITQYHGSINYGGVLQAYALRKIITDMGYKAEQLRYITSSENTAPLPVRAKNLFIKSLKDAVAEKQMGAFIIRTGKFGITFVPRKIFNKLIVSKHRALRAENFAHFNEKYVPSSKVYTRNTIAESVDDYDIFITGSDQVWNPNWFHAPYYLDFVPEEKTKIAYAASTAVSHLTQEQYGKMQPLVSRFQHISVREENAVSMLQGMTDKKIEWVLDPTLLLSAEEWNEVAAENPVIEPYVFAYILGDRKDNQKCAKDFAKKKWLKLVTFPFTSSRSSPRQALFGDIHCYSGPDVWLSLIRDAEYVITDSFHAVVFSIVYRKRFVILQRSGDGEKRSMNSRMYSLCKMFPEIEEMIVGADEVDMVEKEIEWDGIYDALAEGKKESMEWLRKKLND